MLRATAARDIIPARDHLIWRHFNSTSQLHDFVHNNHHRPWALNTVTITSFLSRLFGTFAGPSPAAMSAAKTKAQSLISENPVGMSALPPLPALPRG